jgi:hypothetical protein
MCIYGQKESGEDSCRVNAQGPSFVQPIAIQNPPQEVLMIRAIGKGLKGFCQVDLWRPSSLSMGRQTGLPLTGGGTWYEDVNANPPAAAVALILAV